MDKFAQRKLHVFFILLCMVLLSSCSTRVAKKDGPPNFYVDETRVPNAKPKPEPLAKYGNMRSYVVFGKRYYTMKSSNNYEAVGTASWYGTQFHTRNTSSGEPYNMLGMTAAHKTLPLPTYVEVTNLANHKTIIVKVNDRGPFESNRLIDLSYVAAKKLGMLGRGTTRVKIKAINPYTYGKMPFFAENRHTHPFKPFTFSTNKHTSSFYLQVGAFRKKAHAEHLQKRLIALLATPVKVSKGKLYKVKIGPINDMSLAKRISYRLKSLGLSSNKTFES